jgi:hypothetical protein
MKNFKNPSDAQVREDFPGGFPGDPVNKFQSSGRTELENRAHDYIAKLAGFRKTASALDSGALMQYVPSNGLYVYFRYNKQQTIMCILNMDTVSRSVDFKDYAERTGSFSTATDVLSGKVTELREAMVIPARKMIILELKKSEGKK